METFPYILKLNSVRAGLEEGRISPSWVRITTITMCSKFLSNIDTSKFRDNFTKLGSVTVRPFSSSGAGFEWKMKETAFFNQVTIGYMDAYSKKSIKIFRNGSIQVAGCSSLFDCQRVLKQLSLLAKIVLETDENFLMGEVSVKMINTNFSLNTTINLNKVIKKLRSSPAFTVTFDPDRYSAVKVKFCSVEGGKLVTASIFSTGRIIVTGARALDEIAGAYEMLLTNIDQSTYVAEMAVHETFNMIMGHPFEEWVNVINKTVIKQSSTEEDLVCSTAARAIQKVWRTVNPACVRRLKREFDDM